MEQPQEQTHYRRPVVEGDKELFCCNCGAPFIFTARDQKYYAEQVPPFQNPRRCFPCRALKKAANQQKQKEQTGTPGPVRRDWDLQS